MKKCPLEIVSLIPVEMLFVQFMYGIVNGGKL